MKLSNFLEWTTDNPGPILLGIPTICGSFVGLFYGVVWVWRHV